MVNIDKNLKFKRESQDSAFTILMWDFTKEGLITELKNKLSLISNIKNTFKKVKLNDRLYEYLIQVEKSTISNYSQIVLIGSEIIIIKLDKSDIKILQEYQISKFTISNDEYFRIDWLVDIFENFKFYDIIINNSNTYTHWQGNMYKKKQIAKSVNLDYIKNLNTNWFMVGKLVLPNKNKFLLEHYPNNMSWDEIIQQIDKYEMKKKIFELQEHLDNISTQEDKYIFGSDIYDLIEQYNVKELYLHAEIKKQFDNNIAEKELVSNINFPIILIVSIDKNIDGAHTLLKNFCGILGIKYY